MERRGINYGLQQLTIAVRGLATSRDSLQDRLRVAYTHHITHIQPENLPDELAEDLARLKRRLTQEQLAAGVGPVTTTTNAMDDETARELIDAIVTMWDTTARIKGAMDHESDQRHEAWQSD